MRERIQRMATFSEQICPLLWMTLLPLTRLYFDHKLSLWINGFLSSRHGQQRNVLSSLSIPLDGIMSKKKLREVPRAIHTVAILNFPCFQASSSYQVYTSSSGSKRKSPRRIGKICSVAYNMNSFVEDSPVSSQNQKLPNE